MLIVSRCSQICQIYVSNSCEIDFLEVGLAALLNAP